MKHVEQNLNGQSLRIGIVQSRFNPKIGEGLLQACEAQLLAHGVLEKNITLATVPGALETPLALLSMAESEKFDALIALGAVVRGDTYHFEVVANESARCINEVQLACAVPIANAVLTTDTSEQAIARMETKGAEAASVAIEMANLVCDLS
jgi:6,7-dimethyl-8-ribityllumazine synthase